MMRKTLMFTVAMLLANGAAISQNRPGGNGPLPGDPTYSDPNEEASLPPPRPNGHWVSKWGSLVSDEQKGILGAAMNMTHGPDAEAIAMSECRKKGGNPCKVQATFSNQCVALVTGDKLFSVQLAASEAEASDTGMRQCRAENDVNCRVYYSACSNPVFIPN